MTKITGTTAEECSTDAAEFKDRMRAQCRQIEKYRLSVMRNQGRQLSADEAALEWIANYAEEFAGDALAPE